MQVYKIKPGGFKEMRKQILMRSVPLIFLCGAGGLFISSYNTSSETTSFEILPYFLPCMVLIFGFGLFRGLKRQQALFESYELTITDDQIKREQLHTASISIPLDSIRKIVKQKNNSIAIYGHSAADTIFIPAQLENFSQLEAMLAGIQPFSSISQLPLLQRYPVILIVLTLGLMVCVYTVDNKVVVAITGTTLLAFMIWSLVKTQQSNSIDKKTKRGMWFALIVILSVLGVMIAKLSGFATGG